MENLRRQLFSLFGNPLFHFALLTGAVWLVFARTLGSYFLADDFGEVAYASHIFAGQYNLLWNDFTGNFMHVPGMAVWRPWLMVSLFTDFCLWRANAFGYYLTNLLSYNLVVILFYWLVRSLARYGGQEKKGSLAAFLGALLFAVSPLHCESVSWVVGRVDIICAVFYLACLNFSLVAERDSKFYRRNMTLATITFWLAMWCKEMAIGAPVMVTSLYLLFGQKPLNFKHAFKLTAPLWISTLVYFLLRYLFLGTILGGYVQGIGDSQAANALSRWLDLDTIRRLFFPLAENVFGAHPWQQSCLQGLFIALTLLVVLRLASASISLRWTCLIAIWIATCLAPIYKLWGLGYDLEGGRFCFFLTMPLSLLAPALILLQGKGRQLPRKLDYALVSVATILIVAASGILARAAYLNDLEWVHAGQEVRQLSKNAQQLSGQSGTNQILILGIPKRRGGAHMVLNGNTFTTMLRPPFTLSDVSKPFITFDPIQFSESPFIDSSRFKRLASTSSAQVFVWQSPRRQFKQIQYFPAETLPPLIKLNGNQQLTGSIHRLAGARASQATGDAIKLNNVATGDAIAFDNLRLNPFSADYFEVTVRGTDRQTGPLKLAVSIDDKEPSFFRSRGVIGSKPTLVRIPLSRDWHWYAQPTVESIYLILPPGREMELSQCKLVKSEDVAPLLKLSSGQESFEGATTVSIKDKTLSLSLKVPALPEAMTAQIEISKANTFFDNFPEDDGAAAVMEKVDFPVSKTEQLLHLNAEHLSAGPYYQLRARLRGENGRAVGEIGNPLTIQIGASKEAEAEAGHGTK